MASRARVRLTLLALTVASSVAAAAPAERPRGIILISIDALRADRLSRAPRLKRLAASGVHFRNAVAQAPWTLPSMGTVFTSLLPGRHGLKNRYISVGVSESGYGGLGFNNPNINRLPSATRTLAEAFRDAGWDTAGFTGDAGLDQAYGFGRGFDVYFDSRPFAGFETTAPMALKWLESRGDRPFFLFLHGYDAHGQFAGQASGEAESYRNLRRSYLEGALAPLPAGEKDAWAARYDAQVARADERVGAFLDAAARLPTVSTGVLVVVMSDHGGELFERGGIDHGPTLYDEALRVPLIVVGPGIAPRAVNEQVRLLDVAPTLLDLAGIEDARWRAQAQGVSLRPSMRGERQTLDAVAETDYLYRFSKIAFRAASGDKLIMDLESLRVELYDLRADPGETRDRAGLDPAAVAVLEKRLRAALSVTPSKEPDASADLRMRADALRRQGRYKEAAGLYEKAWRVDPEGLQDFLVQGYSRMSSGDVAGATRMFDAAVEVSSGSPMMRHHKAVQLYRRGLNAEALSEIRKVAAAFKDDESRRGDYLHALMWVTIVSRDAATEADMRRGMLDLRAAATRNRNMLTFYHMATIRYLFEVGSSSTSTTSAAAILAEACTAELPCPPDIRRFMKRAAMGKQRSRAEVWEEMRRFQKNPIEISIKKDENPTNPWFFKCLISFDVNRDFLRMFELAGDDEGYEAAFNEAMKFSFCMPGPAAGMCEAAGRRFAARGRQAKARALFKRAESLYDEVEQPAKAAEMRALRARPR